MPIVMTDLEYLDRAEALLKAVELSCDRLNDETDADIDAQRVGKKSGWRPRPVVFTTALTANLGKTPKARASFWPT